MLWSWLLTAVGVTGLYLAGRKNLWGWGVGIGAQALWIAYALSTEQYGFLASAGAYGWVYVKNFRAWHKERNAERTRRRQGALEACPGQWARLYVGSHRWAGPADR